MVKTKLFFGSFAVTAGLVLALFFFNRPPIAKLQKVSDNVFITSQLETKHIDKLPRQAITTLVDLRPDGEAKDQPTSAAMKLAAELRGLKFFYIPVPHEHIPDEAVAALRDALSDHNGNAVLYCRTGRRAVKTFALVEASRPDGPTTAAILKMVSQAGFSADDISDDMTRRVKDRNLAKGEKL